ncbi:MAG TPA: dihydrofolate reductase family protein [Candidatus Saccharimonadales bacterium]|nr:dihydrofolate reductase family protein [Candidatus Saccharimonadales bacterium]
MRRIVVTEFVSLDGIFEAPGPDGSGYKYEGWTMNYGNDEFMKFKSEELESADAQLLGRITYQSFAIAWPKMNEDEFGKKFNSMKKYVVSKTLKKADATWENSHIIKGDIAKEIARLKEEKGVPGSNSSRSKAGTDIIVYGSGQLVNFLLGLGLVDELRLLVYPVILGEGKRLFKDKYTKLKLIEETTFKTGLIALRYEPILK